MRATVPTGRVRLADAFEQKDTSPMSAWLIHTYRDLRVQTGYEAEREETMGGIRDTVRSDILLASG